MTFEDWMTHRGLSASSVKNYAGAIAGSLSNWAADSGVMVGPLTSLSSSTAFAEVAAMIRMLPVFQENNKRGNSMYNGALSKFAEYLFEGFGSDIEADIDSIVKDDNLSETDKSSLVKARIGQGAFRQKLLLHWSACSVTGFRDTNLLVASHIKPWRASNNTERLDPFNGLLLTPNLDKAFDLGMLTFAPDGHIKLSPLLTEPQKLGLSTEMKISLTPQHEPYLIFHRKMVYRPN
jgi:putative restriction endonuclease